MIGRLKGTVEAVGEDFLILDVGGVGYQVFAAPRVLERMSVGEAAKLSIETVVREDLIRLYGFHDDRERACFTLLQSVQGVGAKAAMAVLQVLPPADLLDAVALGDDAAVARANGVGKKIAQRITTELKGAFAKMTAAVDAGPALRVVKSSASDDETGAGVKADAASALVNLGYDAGEARRAVAAAAARDAAASVEALITAALKELSA